MTTYGPNLKVHVYINATNNNWPYYFRQAISPSKTVSLGDCDGTYNIVATGHYTWDISIDADGSSSDAGHMSDRHSGSVNLLKLDGHVVSQKMPMVAGKETPLRWMLNMNFDSHRNYTWARNYTP